MRRNNFIGLALISLVMMFAGNVSCNGQSKTSDVKSTPKVYFTKSITPEGLMSVYKALGREAKGYNVAVKISTGEPGGHNFLNPALIKDFVHAVNGSIVECNTAYGGGRADAESHLKAARDHGWMDVTHVDIMDAKGEVEIPVTGGKWLKHDIVGKNFLNYDFMVVLSHFKGHTMGGFGGALKNISIGIASPNGKRLIHSGGKSTADWGEPTQEQFLESMAEAASAVINHCGENILYISVINNLSVDCDCSSNPEPPKMGDIGIVASLDPVALDKACVDMIYASDDPGKSHLIERMESRKGVVILKHAEELGVGSQKYQLISLDK